MAHPAGHIPDPLVTRTWTRMQATFAFNSFLLLHTSAHFCMLQSTATVLTLRTPITNSLVVGGKFPFHQLTDEQRAHYIALICQDQQTFVRKSIYGNHFLNTVFYGKVQPAAFLHPQRTISFCLAVMCMHYEYHAYTRISLYSYRDAMLPASVRKRHHTISIRRTQAALIEAASLNMVAMAANPNYRGHSEESLANKTSFRWHRVFFATPCFAQHYPS